MTYRKSFMEDYLTSRGLVVEGDETSEELAEAFGHMRRYQVKKGLA